ncbi:MAG: hypothetical protein P4L96_03860 [Rhodoferax sp.]|nr:hypothetical protein [Rhodoferax sp.]
MNAVMSPQPMATARSAGAEVAGLVPSKTSDTQFSTVCLPNHFEARMDRRVGRLRRTVWASGHLHKFSALRAERVWFVTLTYRGVDDWKANHITSAIKCARQWLKRRTGHKLRYTWVAELQTRGAVHYHLAVWLPKGLTLPKFDKQGWWPYGMTNVQRSFNPVGYLMKYLSKVGAFHKFPKGCRLFGIGGLDAQARGIRTWINYPQWLKQTAGVGEVVRRAGRYLVRETGEILKSPFRMLWTRTGLYLSTVGPVPTRWVDGPYSAVTFGGA